MISYAQVKAIPQALRVSRTVVFLGGGCRKEEEKEWPTAICVEWVYKMIYPRSS